MEVYRFKRMYAKVTKNPTLQHRVKPDSLFTTNNKQLLDEVEHDIISELSKSRSVLSAEAEG